MANIAAAQFSGILEDDSEMVPGYDQSTEEPPRCPIHHPSYRTVKASLEDLIELLHEPLESSPYTDGNVEALKRLLKNRRKTRFPDEVRIAFVGDMASGKSSLVNSLLGKGVLARKGDIGTSCTWVVQEFRKTLQEQNKPFRAEIEYYSPSELEAIIVFIFREACASIAASRDDSSEVQELNDAFDQRNLSGLAAIKTILALFRDKPECASEEAITDFIRQAPDENDRHIVRTMLLWCSELIKEHTSPNRESGAVVEAATPQDLLQQLRKYTFNAMDDDGEGGEASPWPLIKKITFGLDSPLLNDGVILVDLPGLHDCNRTRFRTVQKALIQCTHYLIVAGVSRAQDDETVEKCFGEGFLRKGSGRVISVITHTDRIESGTSLRASNEVQELKLADAREKISNIEGKLDDLQRRRRSAKQTEKLAIYEEQDELQQQLHDAEAAEESYRIMMRNKRVIKSLKRTYNHLTGDQRPLPIFCVSNKAYEKYQIGYERFEQPSLSLEDTQIPALRRHLRLATGQGRFNDAVFHYERQIPSLMSSFELWVCKTHLKRKHELEEIVLEPKEIYTTIIESFFAKIMTHLETQIFMTMKLRESDWITRGSAICTQWSLNYRVGTYLSLLRRDGHRKGTTRSPEICWNKELVRVMTPELTANCKALMGLVTQMEQHVAVQLEEILTQMKDKLSADPQSTLMALGPFLRKIEFEKHIVRSRVEVCFRILKRRLKAAILDLTTSSATGIVDTCMQDVYDQARRISGSGSGTRRPLKIHSYVAGIGGLWMQAHDSFRERVSDILTKRQDALQRHIGMILDGIHESFNACTQDKEVEEQEEKLLREKLTTNLGKAKEIHEGVLRKAMAECKEYC